MRRDDQDMPRWEYAILECETLFAYQYTWTIRYPGSEPERLKGVPTLGGILNNLGRDGWELVSEVVHERAVVPSKGWPHAGIPIATQYTFKRLATDTEASTPTLHLQREQS